MLALVIAATLDVHSARFLVSCERELTIQCGAYLTGFVDAAIAYEVNLRAGVVCLPQPVDMERVRVATVRSVKTKPRKESLPKAVLVALSGLYPCASRKE